MLLPTFDVLSTVKLYATYLTSKLHPELQKKNKGKVQSIQRGGNRKERNSRNHPRKSSSFVLWARSLVNDPAVAAISAISSHLMDDTLHTGCRVSS